MIVDWVTLLINSAVSLSLSIIMFTFGMRAGKERTDRKDLKEKYRLLTAHFQSLLENVISNSPYSWNRFRKNSIEKTPVEEMIKSGHYIDLKNNLFPYLENLEKEVLKYGHYFNELSKYSGEFVLKILKNNQVSLLEETYSIKTNVSENMDNTSYIEYNPAKLYFINEIDEIIRVLKEREAGLCFTYQEGAYIKFNITIRKQDIELIDLHQILCDINYELQNVTYKVELEEKSKIVKQLKKATKKLKKLTKEPFSFWSTLLNAIKDIFR